MPATQRTPCGWLSVWQGSIERDGWGLTGEAGGDFMLTRMRIWLPDDPGVLGAVAAEIGAVHGNVIGLEGLEREAGGAIDELVVELPDAPGAVAAACGGIRTVPGAGVEVVTELGAEAKAREDTVLAAAAGILQVGTPTAAMNALTGHLIALFDLNWLAR